MERTVSHITAQDAELLTGEPAPLKILVPVEIEEDKHMSPEMPPCPECRQPMTMERIPCPDARTGCNVLHKAPRCLPCEQHRWEEHDRPATIGELKALADRLEQHLAEGGRKPGV
jgi:hypothetical protein